MPKALLLNSLKGALHMLSIVGSKLRQSSPDRARFADPEQYGKKSDFGHTTDDGSCAKRKAKGPI